MKTFLLTDGEFTGLIRSLRSLKEKVRIVGICSSENCAHSAMLDATYAFDESEAYFDFLVKIIESERVDYVFPVDTLRLEYLASIKEKICELTGAVVIGPSEECINIANNKAALYEFLKGVDGVKEVVSDYKVVSTFGELRNACEYFRIRNIPCIMKPVRGENAEGYLKIVNEKEFAISALKGGSSHKISIEHFNEFEDSENLPSAELVMPYLSGKEWDVDLLCDGGKILSATVRENMDMFGGLSSRSVTAENPYLISVCEKIASTLNLSCLSCVSFKEDENGNPKILEINPRAMGSIHLSTLAGNNLVEKLLNLLENKYSEREMILTKPNFSTALYYDIIPVGESDEWHTLTAQDKEIYQKYYSLMKTKMTDLSFGCRYAWDGVYNVKWKIIDGCFVQASFNPENPFMIMPFGNYNSEELSSVILKVKEDFDKNGLELKIVCIEEEYLSLFENISIPHEEAKFSEDFSDYVYDGEGLRELKGKKYSKKRNHFSQFVRNYPEYQYASLNSDILDACVENSLEWSENKHADSEDYEESDHLMIKRVIENYDNLNYKGGGILINGKLVAFAIGSEGNNGICFIHFEKAETEYIGVYAAINKLVLENEFPNAKFVNREEDLGHENLRKAKQSYHPIERVNKFSIKIK